jgi:hypothetical protein
VRIEARAIMAAKGDDPAYWEARAEEARALMQKMRDPQSRRLLITIAESYDELAERARTRPAASR